jgi:hypothetical protein
MTSTIQAGYLCPRCTNFDIQAFSQPGFPYRGFLCREVELSALQGCSFCSLLWDQIQHESLVWRDPEVNSISLLLSNERR